MHQQSQPFPCCLKEFCWCLGLFSTLVVSFKISIFSCISCILGFSSSASLKEASAPSCSFPLANSFDDLINPTAPFWQSIQSNFFPYPLLSNSTDLSMDSYASESRIFLWVSTSYILRASWLIFYHDHKESYHLLYKIYLNSIPMNLFISHLNSIIICLTEIVE